MRIDEEQIRELVSTLRSWGKEISDETLQDLIDEYDRRGHEGGMSLADARDYVMEKRGDGVFCPACFQFAKVYRWSLYGSAANMLVRLYKAGGTEGFVESKSVKTPGQGGEATRLRNWGLVEQENERRPDGGKSGYWRVTRLGESFLMGEATIPKYIYVYNGEVLKRDGPDVHVTDVLGHNFNYRKMMEGT